MRRRDLMAIAATQQVREMQEGAKLGYNESSFAPATTRFISSNIPIGTADFSVEYYGNFVGANFAGNNTLFNASTIQAYVKGCFAVYGSTASPDKNYISWIIFEGSASADGLFLNYTHANTLPFHLVITRQGATIKAFINGVLKGTKAQSSVKDFPQFKLGLANSSDCRFARIFNYALSTPQIAALYNNGKSEEYLLTAADKVGCIAEYLPQNLVTSHDGDMADKTPIAWLDSAKQLPLNDEYLPPLLQGVGGYDLTALGTPEIVEKARVIQKIQLNNPMNISDFTSIYGGYVNIIDGNIRVLCDGRANSYGYAIATKTGIFQANIGDTIKWRCYTRTSVDYTATNYFVGATYGWSLYNTRLVRANTEWVLTESTFTVSHENTGGHVLNQFWIMKNYGYTGSGYIEVKNIEIEIYNK